MGSAQNEKTTPLEPKATEEKSAFGPVVCVRVRPGARSQGRILSGVRTFIARCWGCGESLLDKRAHTKRQQSKGPDACELVVYEHGEEAATDTC